MTRRILIDETHRRTEICRDGHVLVVHEELRIVRGHQLWCLVSVLAPVSLDRPMYVPTR